MGHKDLTLQVLNFELLRLNKPILEILGEK